MNREERRRQARQARRHRHGPGCDHIGHPGMVGAVGAGTAVEPLAPGPGEILASYPAIAESPGAHQYEARRETHDRLIQLLGPTRRSGIHWNEADHLGSIAACLDAKAQAEAAGEVDVADQYQLFLDKLEEWPDGVLVVAMAIAAAQP